MHRSPYRTAPGSEPPELAGRAAELGAAAYAIDMAAAGEPPNPIVFVGLRGMGKTAMLREVAAQARKSGALTLVVEADRELRFTDVMRDELQIALQKSEAFPKRLRDSLSKLIDHLPKLSYELPHDAGSVSISGSGDEPHDAEDSIESALLNLNEQLHRDGRYLMIGLDEIQEASRGDLLRIVRVVHKTAGTSSPIFFAGAGLPNTPAILHDVRTYTERWAKYQLDLLDRDATFAAIERPAQKLGSAWDPDALERMYRISRGYPYFIQQYASAAWLHSKTKLISVEDVAAITPGIQLLLDNSLYEPSFMQLTPREAAFVLALHSLGAGSRRLDEVARALKLSSSAAIGSIRSGLAKKDVVFSAVRGRVEFRMPLTNDYIDRNYAAIQTLAELR